MLPYWSRPMLRATLVTTIIGLIASCSKQPAPQATQPEQVAKVVPAEGEGESTEPRVGPNPDGAPVETAPPNVPELKPAFVGQTRAKAVHTQSKFRVSEVAGPFKQPWALAFLPDGRMLITEKHDGRLLALSADGKKSASVSGVPRVDGRDQGGLLDVELSPDFKNDKLVYLSYYEPREGGNGLAVARGRLADGAQPKLLEPKVVFRMQPTLDSTKHAGGRLVFAPDGTLFVTLGERSIKEGRVQAQDLSSHLGKVVRVLPDGKVPKDNPFANKPGARPEIFSSGTATYSVRPSTRRTDYGSPRWDRAAAMS